MQLLAPPMKVMVFPYIPHTFVVTESALPFVHRSGLNSRASSPQICVLRFTAEIEM
jgi:hypothetical protein